MKGLLKVSGAGVAALCLAAAAWADSSWVLAHSALKEPGAVKSSNGYVVQWNALARDRAAVQVEAFDSSGRAVLALAPLKTITDAAAIAIYDVSIRANQPAVVAMSIVRNDGRRHAELGYFNWDGSLGRRVDLTGHGEASKIEIDSEGLAWALTAEGAVEVVGTGGRIVNMALHERVDSRDASFGLTEARVWIWQPARNRMLVADRTGGNEKAFAIAAPAERTSLLRVALRRREHAAVSTVAMLDDRRAVMAASTGRAGALKLYVSNGKSFRAVTGGQGFLVGADGHAAVFARETRPESADFEFLREPLNAGGLQ